MKKHCFIAIAAALVLAASGIFFLIYQAALAVTTSGDPSALMPCVIIDAGHGGFDGGAEAEGVIEKDVNLAIAKKLSQLCEVYGMQVTMIRETDASVEDEGFSKIRERKVSDIHNRLAVSQKKPHAIYISIHQNKFPQEQYWGTQVFYGTKNEQSKALAQRIQNEVVSWLQPENHREIKPAEKNLYILYNTSAPAVLVECGFLSNQQERERLLDEEYQQQLAFAIFTALIGHCQVMPMA